MTLKLQKRSIELVKMSDLQPGEFAVIEDSSSAYSGSVIFCFFDYMKKHKVVVALTKVIDYDDGYVPLWDISGYCADILVEVLESGSNFQLE